MKNIVVFVGKLLLKTTIALALAILHLLNFMLVLFNATLRYAVLPVMFVAAVIAITTYSDSGLTRDVVECIWTFLAAGAFYFVMPYTPWVFALLIDMLSVLFHSISLTRKSPVKYVFD